MAIKAGCRWIRLTGAITEEAVNDVIPICQESGTILILDNNIKLVDKLRIHGVHLTQWSRGEVIAAREELGPHAILGITCNTPANFSELTGLDVDYVVIQNLTSEYPQKYFQHATAILRNANQEIHPVAESEGLPVSIFPSLIDSGIEGFELSGSILNAPNPTAFIELAMQSIK